MDYCHNDDFLSQFPEEMLKALCDVMKVVTISEGQVLFYQGDVASSNTSCFFTVTFFTCAVYD